jgi:hypothetical protein
MALSRRPKHYSGPTAPWWSSPCSSPTYVRSSLVRSRLTGRPASLLRVCISSCPFVFCCDNKAGWWPFQKKKSKAGWWLHDAPVDLIYSSNSNAGANDVCTVLVLRYYHSPTLRRRHGSHTATVRGAPQTNTEPIGRLSPALTGTPLGQR